MNIFRDFLLSFCPAKVRQACRPSSQLTVLRVAMWSGAAQFLLITLMLIGQCKQYFIARSHQIAPHMDGVNSTGEAVVTVIIVLEFLFHPLSLCLLYLAFEGAVALLAAWLLLKLSPVSLCFFSSTICFNVAIDQPTAHGPSIGGCSGMARQSDTYCLSRGEVRMELQPYHWHQ